MPFCCNKSPRQRNVQSDLTLHFRVGGYQFSSIYVIVFKSLRLQRVHTYPDSLRFQKFPLWRPFSKVCGYGMRFRRIRVDAKRNRNKMFADTNESGYVWTGPDIVTYFVRSGIQVFPNVRSGEVGTLNTPYTCLRLVLVFRCVLETLIPKCDWVYGLNFRAHILILFTHFNDLPLLATWPVPSLIGPLVPKDI